MKIAELTQKCGVNTKVWSKSEVLGKVYKKIRNIGLDLVR